MDNLDNRVAEQECGEGSGVLFPFFDPDCSIIFLAPKGEGSVRYYEVVGDSNECKLYQLFQYSAKDSQRALCAMPKRGLNTSKCEIMRFFKVFNSSALVEPISFIVPRRVEGYQEDLFPDTPGPEPALTGEEWASGKSSEPILVSLKDLASATTSGTEEMTAASAPGDTSKEVKMLEAEISRLQEALEASQAEVVELKRKLRTLEPPAPENEGGEEEEQNENDS
jgi:hypothetical protein